MKKILLLCIGTLSLFARVLNGKVPLASTDIAPHHGGDLLVSSQMIENILNYQKWGELFTYLQVHWFRVLFFGITVGVLVVFFLHYVVIGPKRFKENGKMIQIYSMFKRVIHWMAALAFTIIIPTGFMMIFGKELGGGELVLTARHLHSIGTVLFIISFIPMFLMWLMPMLLNFDDIKWIFMLGGYLTKKEVFVPAGEFNFGQKMWFWVAIIGGFVMIFTGGLMYFESIHLAILDRFNLDQVDILRISAISHNFLGMLVTAFFITHLYMSLFAVQGSLSSMIHGKKSEDDLKHMNNSLYKKLKKEDKI